MEDSGRRILFDMKLWPIIELAPADLLSGLVAPADLLSALGGPIDLLSADDGGPIAPGRPCEDAREATLCEEAEAGIGRVGAPTFLISGRTFASASILRFFAGSSSATCDVGTVSSTP